MIIGISGKIGSGKDTVGKIIQVLTQSPHFTNRAVVEFLERDILSPRFLNMKFADTLKDFICVLINCTREKLEDRDFKESPLPEHWWYYKLGNGKILPRGYYPNKVDNDICEKRYLIKTTPRLLLQLMGTECGRNILHPNVWVNALMSKYVKYTQDQNHSDDNYYPNWVITDMRFPNELTAVEERGFSIRVNRQTYPKTIIRKDDNEKFIHLGNGSYRTQWGNSNGSINETPFIAFDKSSFIFKSPEEHPSETGLDNSTFKYTIDNKGTLSDLVDEVKEILIKEKIISYE